MLTGIGRRRTLIVGGTAAVATLTGISVGLWRGARPTDALTDALAHAVGEALWSQKFSRPGGGELAMAAFRGRPLLINFWATWCPPCLREMPVLDRFARQFAANGWQVLGLAADQEKPVLDFLSRNPVSYPIALAGFEGIAISRSLGNELGALPFTLAVDALGRITQRHLGESHFELLARWVTPR